MIPMWPVYCQLIESLKNMLFFWAQYRTKNEPLKEKAQKCESLERVGTPKKV